jgi:glycine betaine/proline transport system ATP-binding protein
MRIGDRIAIMQNGEVVQVGTPDEILNNPAMIMSAPSSAA